MDITLLQTSLSPQTVRYLRSRARADERGEGVISAAIAVLIMAVIGAALFLAFRDTSNSIKDKVNNGVNQIQ